jgi:hypothetical protein
MAAVRVRLTPVFPASLRMRAKATMSRPPTILEPIVSGRSSVRAAWSWLESCGHVTDFLDEAKGAGYAFETHPVALIKGPGCNVLRSVHSQ